jgi:hypothetical protein
MGDDSSEATWQVLKQDGKLLDWLEVVTDIDENEVVAFLLALQRMLDAGGKVEREQVRVLRAGYSDKAPDGWGYNVYLPVLPAYLLHAISSVALVCCPPVVHEGPGTWHCCCCCCSSSRIIASLCSAAAQSWSSGISLAYTTEGL